MVIHPLLAVDIGGTGARIRAEVAPDDRLGASVGDLTALARGHLTGHHLRWEGAGDPERDVSALLALAERALLGLGRQLPDAVAVAFPGSLDEHGVVRRWPSRPGWTGFALGAALAERFGVPAIIRDDALMAAHAEALARPAGTGHGLIYLGLGTGVGGAYVPPGATGRLADIVSCEPGHLIVWPGASETCDCGRTGCLQAYASGPAVHRLTAAVGPAHALEKAVRALAIVVANLAELYPLGRIVIGGGFGSAHRDLVGRLASAAVAWRRPGTPLPVPERSVYGSRSSLLGAVLVARTAGAPIPLPPMPTGDHERILV